MLKVVGSHSQEACKWLFTTLKEYPRQSGPVGGAQEDASL
jgi:hypothetical protein